MQTYLYVLLYNFKKYNIIYKPVTGASISIIVFSERNSMAPSVMMRNAAASSMRPSSMKCCLSTSGFGLPELRLSNTSATVSLCAGGNRTPAKHEQYINGVLRRW